MTTLEFTEANLKKWADEELSPEFEPFIRHNESIGRMIQHPLLYDIGVMLPGLANRQLEQKKIALQRAIDSNDLGKIIVLHERPWRMEALLNYGAVYDEDGRVLPIWQQSDDFREEAAFVWTDSENIHQYREQWLDLYRDRPDGVVLGDKGEFRKLPDRVTLFRGGDPEESFLSWSTRRSIAEFFAQRGPEPRTVQVVEVERESIFAYYTNRNEYEALTMVGMAA